jgi:uncharacterized protein involved in response to NO
MMCAMTPPATQDPYRVLFPVGVAYAVLGASLWPLALLPGVPYPGVLHSTLMIEGFELAFVAGFLLTITPRITRTDPSDQRELPWVVALAVGTGIAALAGMAALAHACALAMLVLLALAVGRRLRMRQNDPPEEILFVPVGLALGIAGAGLQLLASAGWLVEPAPRLGIRLMSLGMVLSFVLGFGALLVPVFLEIRDPLVIPRIARAHERSGRRALYAGMAVALALTFVADALGAGALAAFGRATVATAMLGLAWKVWRPPGRRTLPAFVLWGAGWLIGIGLWAAALFPRHEIAALHLTLLGGFGTLTMGIASRVVVTHGGHGPAEEARVVTPVRAACIALALAARLGAEIDPLRAAWWLASSAVLWILAWLGWIMTARRYLRRDISQS